MSPLFTVRTALVLTIAATVGICAFLLALHASSKKNVANAALIGLGAAGGTLIGLPAMISTESSY